MTAKNWTPPPKMPDGKTPLPIGRNGKPLVYCGIGGTFKTCSYPNGLWLLDGAGKWDDYDGMGWIGLGESTHYAAESDSEVCHLNQWGDFTPEAQNEPVKAAQSSTFQTYLEAIESAIEEAEKEWQKAVSVAAAWAEELKARREVRDRLQLDPAQICEAWYMTGRIDGRSHAPCRKTFPIHP